MTNTQITKHIHFTPRMDGVLCDNCHTRIIPPQNLTHGQFYQLLEGFYAVHENCEPQYWTAYELEAAKIEARRMYAEVFGDNDNDNES